MSSDLLLRCYNKGCGKEYKEEENGEGNHVIQFKTEVPEFLSDDEEMFTLFKNDIECKDTC